MKNGANPRCDISKASVLTCFILMLILKKQNKTKTTRRTKKERERYQMNWIRAQISMNSYIFVCETEKRKSSQSCWSWKLFFFFFFSRHTFWKPRHWLCFFFSFFNLDIFVFVFLLSNRTQLFCILSFFLSFLKRNSFFSLHLGMEAWKERCVLKIDREKQTVLRMDRRVYWTVFYLEIEFCSLTASLDFALWLQKAVGSNPTTSTACPGSRLVGAALGSDRASAIHVEA